MCYSLSSHFPLVCAASFRQTMRSGRDGPVSSSSLSQGGFISRFILCFGILSFLPGLLPSISALMAQDCIDYSDYLHLVGGVGTPGSARDVAISGSHAYVADYGSGLQVIDISDPSSPWIVGGVNTPGAAYGVAVAGNYVYMADFYDFQVLPTQCGLFIEATPGEAIIPPGGNFVQDVVVTNTTDSSRTVQISFAARLPSNDFSYLLGPVPRNGVDVEGNSSIQHTLNYPVPPNKSTPFIVGFVSYLHDYETGDTLDIDETWVMITEVGAVDTGRGEDSQGRGWEYLSERQDRFFPARFQRRRQNPSIE